MIALDDWRAACPDITDDEWPHLIDAFGVDAFSATGARVALAAFRRGREQGWIAGYDEHVEDMRERRERMGHRGWSACVACHGRRLTITCANCGQDHTEGLLRRWGYPTNPEPERDPDGGRKAADALQRAWTAEA